MKVGYSKGVYKIFVKKVELWVDQTDLVMWQLTIYFLNRLTPSFWIKVPNKRHKIYIVWFVVSLGVMYKLLNWCRCLKNMDLGKRCEVQHLQTFMWTFFSSLIFVVRNFSCVHVVLQSFVTTQNGKYKRCDIISA